MNLSETALMLGQMQAYDQRTVGESDVIAWHALLADAPFEDCQEAVRRHYAENTDRIMPAHVRRIVRGIHGEREMAARATGWAAGQAGVPKGQAHPEITGPIDSSSMAPELKAALRELLSERFPEASREKLKPRTVAWEREHRSYVRLRDGELNPHYRRGFSADQVWVDELPA